MLAGGDRDAGLLVRATARLDSVSHCSPAGLGIRQMGCGAAEDWNAFMSSSVERTLLEAFAVAGIKSSSELLLAV